METHAPKPLNEIRKERKQIRNVNAEQKQSMSSLNKVALWITQHVGTMGFFIIIFIWTTFWLGWNTLASPAFRFDPFPAFVFWLFMSNMIQIFLMPLLMIDQKAEMEIETVLMHLENQNQVMENILHTLEQKKSLHVTK
jgi:uncharacterized membrane protein